MAVKKVPEKEPEDLITAVQTGDRLETLIALRDLLANRLQNSRSDRDIASMSRRLMQCISEIEVLQKEKEALEESGGHLREMRKRLAMTAARMAVDYKEGRLDREHEGA